MKSNEVFSGFVRTISLLGHGKDKPLHKEKSKDVRIILKTVNVKGIVND